MAKFKRKMSIEIRRQEKLDIVEENFRKGELPGKYIAKMLYEWDNGRFENKYLKKLERNWQRWKRKSSNTSSSRSRSLEGGVMSDI